MTAMKRIVTLLAPVAVLAVAIAVLEGACNDVGDCPAASTIAPGGACSGNDLQCPYTLQTPSPACDGTEVDGGLETSCICTKGTWACPSPVSCGGGGTDDGGPEAGVDSTVGDGGAGDDGGPETGVDSGVGDSGGDSAADAEGGSGDAMGGGDSGGDAEGGSGDAMSD
jgi:hypothetical protein